jgi:hypothetical protein
LLKEVDGDEDEDAYVLRPYGLLRLKLGNEDAARAVCDALELHMRRHKRSVYVDDEGLHFGDGLDDEDFAIVTRAIIWHDLTDTELKEQATQALVTAVEAARRKTWERRRAEIEG